MDIHNIKRGNLCRISVARYCLKYMYVAMIGCECDGGVHFRGSIVYMGRCGQVGRLK